MSLAIPEIELSSSSPSSSHHNHHHRPPSITTSALQDEAAALPPQNSSPSPFQSEDNNNNNDNNSLLLLLPVTPRRQAFILLSSFLTICITIGLNQSYGVFQSYYTSPSQTLLLLDPIDVNGGSSGSSGAWIAFVGTLGAGLTWGGSIVVNPLMARVRDVRWLTVSGVVCMSAGFLLASFASRIWHLLLTQGLLYGIGSSLLYFPILSITPEYFSSHRGAAMGLVLSGSGVGGLVLSPLTRLLLMRLSVRPTLRALALLTLVLSLPIALTAPPSRFPRSSSAQRRRPTHVDLALARRPAFAFSVAAAALQAAGNLLPLTFLVEYSVALGYTPGFGAVLLAVSNGVNAAFRILTGVAGDRFGRQNTLILMVVCSAVTVVAFWLGSTAGDGDGGGNRTLWILFVVFYGVAGGGYNALFPTTVVEVFGLQAYASVNGFMYFVRGLGAMVGSPVGGKILGRSELANYRNVVWFDAALLAGASVCVVSVRFLDAVDKKAWRWKA